MLKTISLIVFLGCAVSAYGRAEVRGVNQSTLTIPAGHTFHVVHSYGDVGIRRQPGREASIRASIKCSADNEADAQSFCNEIRIGKWTDAEQKVSGVRTGFPQNPGRKHVGYRVDYEIVLPEDTPLDLTNKYGNVTLTNLRADVLLRNSFGNVEVRAHEGTLKITNANGSVTASDLSGDALIANSLGPVEIKRSGGAIMVENQDAPVTVETRPGRCRPITISTTFAPLRVTLGAGGGYNLDAKASFGKVSSNLEIEARHHNVRTRNGQVIESLITGRLSGAGSCDLRLVNSNGDIEILKGAR